MLLLKSSRYYRRVSGGEVKGCIWGTMKGLNGTDGDINHNLSQLPTTARAEGRGKG